MHNFPLQHRAYSVPLRRVQPQTFRLSNLETDMHHLKFSKVHSIPFKQSVYFEGRYGTENPCCISPTVQLYLSIIFWGSPVAMIPGRWNCVISFQCNEMAIIHISFRRGRQMSVFAIRLESTVPYQQAILWLFECELTYRQIVPLLFLLSLKLWNQMSSLLSFTQHAHMLCTSTHRAIVRHMPYFTRHWA